MRVVVPFAAETPKTRLESALTPAERSTVARAMLADVLRAIVDAGHEPTVVSTAPLALDALDLSSDIAASTSIAVDNRSLTDAVNARLPVLETDGDEGETESDDATAAPDPVAVVMADLALATPDALERLLSASADVAIAPGRGGGTNALVVRHPEFRVDYHGTSYLDHREIAREVGATLETIDSFRLATDIDEPADLVEVLVHGREGDRAPARLREMGFELDGRDGRVGIARSEDRATK
ncbi:2-phospho-L-lactate guanylyltransferase [Natrinema versiforme]|uniref:2-phospho-L-lactate guanylyltransferase n=1 Tax=Natrinema versiforme JCM 10478 TaxID=1227496 RepID=L9YB84_9EURY|nr:2-phospho-L-lactate guanylyltransferase [Natrinema versiforme]ELY70972.1 2-phospho-L-lactate guanylyltransferase CofC [Natrinema versiforme JCM 10478]